MRVLWVDADGNPWTDLNGWRVLEDFGVAVNRVPSVPAALKQLGQNEFDLLLVRAETADAPSLLVQARRAIGKDGRKIVLTSSTWTKEQFRSHSKTDGAAHRYARVPMPPEGFLNLVADLFGCPVDELAEFEVVPELEDAEEEAPKKPKSARRTSIEAEAGDIDVLRKYLSIREEQLGIVEGEREELSRENERLQKEAHQLQLKLREFQHVHDELEKRLEQMQEEKSESDRKLLATQEDSERNLRLQQDRIRGLEIQISEAGDKYENLRGRVRKDIRKIRENERDLEARLELMRKDSETLMQARDVRVLELQRKIDALEFDLDQVQDSRVQAQMEAERYLAKLSRVSRALQIANHMIEDDRATEAELEELEPFSGGAANAEEPPPALSAVDAETPTTEMPSEQEGGEAPAPSHELSPELEALASDGEATRIVTTEQLSKVGGESSSSG